MNFEDIMKKRDVVRALNELDQCIEDAKLRKRRAEEEAKGGQVEVPTA
jgi:kinetochore protein NNF1